MFKAQTDLAQLNEPVRGVFALKHGFNEFRWLAGVSGDSSKNVRDFDVGVWCSHDIADVGSYAVL